jgi:hypothetical protein
MSADFKIGDLVQAKAGTLAHFCGDKHGKIEAFDGSSVMVRMDSSGRLIPFASDQLYAVHRPTATAHTEGMT